MQLYKCERKCFMQTINSFQPLILISLLFRVKVPVLFLCQAMLALTVCLTSWSTSLSIMDSALTFFVLVSVSYVIVFLLSFLRLKDDLFASVNIRLFHKM